MSETLRALVIQSQDVSRALIESGGEITPELESALAEIDTKIPAKIDSYAVVMERLDMESEYWKQKADFYARISKGCKSAKERLKESLKFSMSQLGVDEIKGVDVRFKLTKSKPTLALNESLLDKKYLVEEVVTSVDKKAVEADLKSGAEVDGAMFVENVALRMYANSKEGEK